jgi:hypothetical protein
MTINPNYLSKNQNELILKAEELKGYNYKKCHQTRYRHKWEQGKLDQYT